MAAKSDKSKQHNKVTSTVIQVLEGRAINLGIFKRNFPAVICVVAMLLISIIGKFDCRLRLSEINRLNGELKTSETRLVEASSAYNTMIRESNLTKLVDTLNLGLISPEQPPYIISDK